MEQITVEEYGKSGLGGVDVATAFEFLQTGKYERDIETTRKLNPAISSFEQWVENNHETLAAILK